MLSKIDLFINQNPVIFSIGPLNIAIKTCSKASYDLSHNGESDLSEVFMVVTILCSAKGEAP